VQDMVRDGSIPKAAAGWANTDLESAFERGEIAMMINEPAVWNTLSNGDVCYIVPPLTGFHGDKGTILWYSALWLYQSCANKPKALEFMNWWLSHQSEMWSKGGTTPLPVRKSFYHDTSVLRDSRTKLVVDQYLPVGKILSAPCSHALPTLNKVEGQNFLPTLAQDLLGLQPIDASLSKVQTALAGLGSTV
jgi:multiple sugar transport system substrate-binding protein